MCLVTAPRRVPRAVWMIVVSWNKAWSVWSCSVMVSIHCPGTVVSELANSTTGVGVCSSLYVRPFEDCTKDRLPLTRTRHRGSRFGKSSCSVQSSLPSEPVDVDLTTKNRLCLCPRMTPGRIMSGMVTNDPGAWVDGRDGRGDRFGETGWMRSLVLCAQSSSITWGHQVETFGLIPMVVGRMMQRPSGVASCPTQWMLRRVRCVRMWGGRESARGWSVYRPPVRVC